jgi:hypothetical protein
MSEMIRWIAAEAERPEVGTGGFPFGRKRRYELERPPDGPAVEKLTAHSFGARADKTGNDLPSAGENPARGEEATPLEQKPTSEERQRAIDDASELERVRRIYRTRTVAMLRRYFRYSIECGRLPSILGSEFFRAKVTSYTVVTFEDRVIFVHDMETCLEKLDKFSRQLIGRHILQEHDRWATARLLHCNEKTVRRLTPVALDLFGEILLDVGLLEYVEPDRENSCQGGPEGQIAASDSEEGRYKIRKMSTLPVAICYSEYRE